MGFGFPLFLWALASIAVPIVIHLFHFRRYRTIYFSTTRFLKEVVEQQKKVGRLRQLLVLASRLLALVFLVMAFSQPFIGQKSVAGEGTGRKIMIYVDNTFSMSLGDGARNLLSEAKDHAASLINNLNAGDKVMLLTNNLEGNLQRWMNKQEALQVVEDIHFASSVNNLTSINNRIQTIQRETPGGIDVVFYLSDFQKYAMPDVWDDTTYRAVLIPLTARKAYNISIDSVWMADPVIYRQAVNKMVVRIRNSGEQASTRITLHLDGEVRAVDDVQLKENGVVMDTLQFTLRNAGWQRGMVAIEDFPVTFDDRMHFAFEAASSNRVLLMEEVTSPRAVYNVFRSDAFFSVDKEQAGRIDFSSLSYYNLVVLNEVKTLSQGMAQALARYVNDGGSLYFIPADNGDLDSYNYLLNLLGAGNLSGRILAKSMVNWLNDKEAVIYAAFEKIPRNVDLPEVNSFYPIGTASKVAERPLMKLDNGRPFINMYRLGSGVVYLQASSLQSTSTNFSSKAMFPPIVYNMAVFKANPRPLYYTAGSNELIEGITSEAGKDQVIYMKSGKYEWIPPVKPVGNQLSIAIPGELAQDGSYDIVRSDKLLSVAAINFSRQESSMEFYTKEELANRYSAANVEVADIGYLYQTAGIAGLGKSFPLWKLFLILALVSLVAEVLLLRFAGAKSTQ